MEDTTMTEKALEKTDHSRAQVTAQPQATLIPNVDIIESEHEFTLVADMPGVDKDGLEIDLERNTLTVRGHVVAATPGDKYQLSHREYRVGSYERAFTLGNEIDRDKVKATVKDGVLTLILPKAEHAQPRRISVKAG